MMKRVKGIVFTPYEKQILRDQTVIHKHILDNKSNNAGAIYLKNEVWNQITIDFNSRVGVTERSKKQLQNLWKNLKSRFKLTQQSVVVNSEYLQKLDNEEIDFRFIIKEEPNDTVVDESDVKHTDEITYNEMEYLSGSASINSRIASSRSANTDNSTIDTSYPAEVPLKPPNSINGYCHAITADHLQHENMNPPDSLLERTQPYMPPHLSPHSTPSVSTISQSPRRSQVTPLTSVMSHVKSPTAVKNSLYIKSLFKTKPRSRPYVASNSSFHSDRQADIAEKEHRRKVELMDKEHEAKVKLMGIEHEKKMELMGKEHKIKMELFSLKEEVLLLKKRYLVKELNAKKECTSKLSIYSTDIQPF